MVKDDATWPEDYELQTLSLVGTALADRYEIERLLGQGGMGSVYLATDQLLDRQVAIKLMNPGIIGRQNPGRFYREARTLARMNHPNIVTLHNCGWYGDQAYLVMEYADGTNLHSIMTKSSEGKSTKHRLTISEAMNIAICIAKALAYAHRRGVIHCDIKPGNIIVGDEVKLMDFGIARMRQEAPLTMGTEVTGTPFYMAPEQSLGKDVDERSDLYSFGVVLYELFTGRPPFLVNDEMSLASQHIQIAPVVPSLRNPSIPKSFDSVILAMLDKDPNRRPAVADEVLTALEAMREDLPDAVSVEIPKPKEILPSDQPKVAALRNIPLLASISIDDLSELSRKLMERSYQKGQVIFHKDEFGSTVYIIISGGVKVSIPSEHGEDIILAYLGPDNFFGELALLDEKPRSATVTAIEPTKTWVLERGDFMEFLKWYPETAIRILRVLTQRLRNVNSHLENVVLAHPMTRLAKALVELLNSYGSEKLEGWEISIPITMVELARIVGLPVGQTRRLIHRLKTSGIINIMKRRYIIQKLEELREIANRR